MDDEGGVNQEYFNALKQKEQTPAITDELLILIRQRNGGRKVQDLNRQLRKMTNNHIAKRFGSMMSI